MTDTCTVELPGGLVLGDGRRMYVAELRPLRGREEDWLAHERQAPSALIVTRLLGACLVRLGDLPGDETLARRLLVGDRDYLMLQLRRMLLGDTISAVVTCPRCGDKMDVEFQASDIPIEQRLQSASSYTCLAAPERTIHFRLPTGADQEAVLGMEANQAVQLMFERCLLDTGGDTLSAEEREAVIGEMERLAPQIALELDLVCPECEHTFEMSFDLTTFFFNEMRISNAQLLQEIHHLALHYHWSEAAILRLTRPRRRAYLALLAETLRGDTH